MGFWIFLLICNMVIPILMIVCGWMMRKHTPKKINGIYGYRTKMSMKNEDTWKFAHEYGGKLWWKVGWIMAILSVAVQLPSIGKGEDAVGILAEVLCLLQCVVLILSILPTEKALKRTFYSDGSRR